MSRRKVEVEEIITSNDELHAPVLLAFQNGLPNKSSISSMDYFEAKNEKTKERVAVITNLNGNVYNGKIQKSSKHNLTNTFIGIKNNITNKIRFIQVEEASMINQIFNEKVIEAEQFPSMDVSQMKSLLIKNFGGRKAIRNYERSEKIKVDVDIVQSQLNATVENIEMDVTDQEIKTNIDSIYPPFNKDAKKIGDLYTLTDVIPQELLDRLNEECHEIIETELENIPIKSKFILNRIEKVQKSSNPISEENLNVLKVCLYMDALNNLIQTRQRSMNKMELSKITEKIENHIIENFSDPNLSQKTKSMYTRDKAMSYLLTLALLVSDNYEINRDTLSEQFQLSKNKMARYFKFINAKVKYGTNILSFVLPNDTKVNMVNKRKSK